MTTQLNELVDVVADDETGENVLETLPRSQANGKLTWTSQVIVMDRAGLILATLRAKQEGRRYSCFWEIGITETVRSRETKAEAGARGLEEELGITGASPCSLLNLFPNFYRNPADPKDAKNAMMFLYFHDGAIRPNPKEIAGFRQLVPEEIEREIREGSMKYTPMNVRTWEMCKDYVKQASGLYARR